MRRVILTIEVLDDDRACEFGAWLANDLGRLDDYASKNGISLGSKGLQVEKSEASRLTEAYYSLYPKESPDITLKNNPGMNRESIWDSATQTYQNWLDVLATTNWCGKVTKAYFKMIGVPLPKRKDQMTEIVKNRLGI
jgi:hypothetical protein